MKNKKVIKFVNEFIKHIIPRGISFVVITAQNRNLIIGDTHSDPKAYDAVIVINILEDETDIQGFLEEIFLILKPGGRLVIIYQNYLHVFLDRIFNQKQSQKTWLSTHDIVSFLSLTQFELITKQPLYLVQTHIELLSKFLNLFLIYFFPFNHLARLHYVIARKILRLNKDLSTSIIIPACNESGNIKYLFNNLPLLGSTNEAIFVEGNSRDDTRQEILSHIEAYKTKLPINFKFIDQGSGIGKADAVIRGINKATGEIILILDADLSVKPIDLHKFYLAIIRGNGEFINGSRLVYSMEKGAMQSLNILANKMFSVIYSFILGQEIKDTLCGTKAFFRKDYLKMKQNGLFGRYDPFGDFDLLTGAAGLSLKIVDLPVRYHERTYGSTNIKRFQNGWELFKYSILAFRHLKVRSI